MMNGSVRRFRTTVEARPGGGLSIRVPFDPSAEWGQRDRFDVTGSIGGYKVRGKLLPRSDGYCLEPGPAWRRDNPIEPGMQTEVALAPEGPQLSAMADDIASALDAEPQARRFFEGLPTFYRKNFMRWIEQARRPETRAQRIAETVATLKAGKRQR
jgi:bacteriocin resistance YdeI/OmpD-like protein/uncharacterized protein DUF1905